ncbi:MAG TPA: exodeoxyribonuclease VII large subunit [Acidimicrobiales bacterium]|nr:exodeoxyribonuclease VII large subunit [Acidimicrobiales bacterium]
MQDALFGSDAVVDPTWTVAELTRAIGKVVEQAFPGEVWVRGEIRDLPPPGDARRTRPHLYFDLIEPGPPGARPGAVLPVVLWSTDRKRVNAELRRSGIRVSAMDSGVDVRIRGRIRWWAPGGRVQLQMTGIDPEYTLGRLAADRAAVVAALAADGLLDRNAALPLPLVPERVGLVTSLGSAAHADVRRVLETAGLAHLLVEVDTRTQGPDTVTTVPRALAAAVAAGAELVLLVRGGGSRVELAWFDDEAVARAVATCPVPVLTGIGHEIDDSVADRVAHTACPTPTAAAVEVVAAVARARDRAEGAWAAIGVTARRALAQRVVSLATTGRHTATVTGATLRAADAHLLSASRRVHRAGPTALAVAGRRLDDVAGAVGRDARRDLAGAGRRLDAAAGVVARRAGPALDRRHRDLEAREARVRASDPALALARGWSITYGPGGSLVRDPGALAPGDELHTVVAAGTVHSRVERAEPVATGRAADAGAGDPDGGGSTGA